MADNVTLNPGSGGSVIATDDDGTAQHQYVKVEFGGDGIFTKVTSSTGLPVGDAGGSLTVDAPVATPVFVRLSDGSSAISTLPVSAASLPLPTGASTAAKQPALGTAGTASSDVLTVQGIASMTPLLATVTFASAQAVTQSGTWNVGTVTTVTTVSTVTNLSQMSGAAISMGTGVRDSGTQRVTIATNDVVPASQSGTWDITNVSGTVSLPTGAATAAKQPALGTAGTASADVITVQGITSMTPLLATVTFASAQAVTQSGTWNIGTVTAVTTVSTVTSLTQFNGNAIDTNSGSKSAGTLRVVLATDQPQLTNKLLVTPDANSAVNISQMNGVTVTMGNGVSGTGVQRVTIASDSTGTVAATQSGTWTVQPGNTANSTPWLVTDTPATSGGLSLYSVISSGAANQDAAAIKGGAGQIYGYSFSNTTASNRYAKLYNLASGATSASTPILRVLVPAGGGANVSMDKGIVCNTGISIRLTTGAADSDTGSCSANDVLANVWYK